jgi:hypothetical protein
MNESFTYTGFSFMNEAFTCQHHFPHYQLQNPKTVEGTNGCPISSGGITEYVEIQYTIADDHGTLTAYITSLTHYPVILGIPGLKRHDVNVNFTKNDIQLSSPGYLPCHAMVPPTQIKGITTECRNNTGAISATRFRHIINNGNKCRGKLNCYPIPEQNQHCITRMEG